MIRLRSIPVLVGLLTASLWSPAAEAYEIPEHELVGRVGAYVACSQSFDAACDNVELASMALGEPDNCHSFYHSDAGLRVSDEDKAKRRNCNIMDGRAGIYPPSYYYDYSVPGYVLGTNTNHFGAPAIAHYELYQELARQAAQQAADLEELYGSLAVNESAEEAVARSQRNIDQCNKAAVGLSAFATHYLSDSLSTGHMWNPEPRYTLAEALGEATMAGMRSCLHGQTGLYRLGTSVVFWCPPELPGLGLVPRSMSGPLYDPVPRFIGDGGLLGAPAAQWDMVMDASIDAITEVAAIAAGESSPAPPAQPSYVTNLEMCRVALGACCHDVDPETSGIRCDSCAPDITHTELFDSCPIGPENIDPPADPANPGNAAMLVLEVDYGNQALWVELLLPDEAGNQLASTLGNSGGNPSRIHPDAAWDRDNDIVDRLGCTTFRLLSVDAEDAVFDDPTINYATLTWEGNPKFPLAMYRSEAPGCTLNCNDSGVGYSVSKEWGQKVTTAKYPHICINGGDSAETAAFYYWIEDARGMRTNRVLETYQCLP